MKSKRVLSLVLAMVMVLGTFGTVFADTAEPVTENEKVQWLINQELIKGDEKGNLNLQGKLTRAELARIVVIALEEEAAADSLKASVSGFVDMVPGNWANGYAAYANAKGYMVGNEKREFMPAKEVTYAEALTVLTRIALGGDITEEERDAAFTWYGPYIAKAADLRVTEGVTVPEVGNSAVKEDVLVMLYNVLNNKDYGNYNVLKVIVLENDRITRLDKNEVTIEVIQEVQRANFVEESRDFKGEQYTYELPAKYNAEDLLGKVVDMSINRDNKVVEVKMDDSYKVITGNIKDISTSRLSIGGSQYVVNLDERYDKSDERVYRTYLNDEALSYRDFAKEKSVEYARVTVKAGKVYFVDAYNFEDIMPVKDVKEVRGKDHIIAYDDVRDGSLLEVEVKDTRVILVKDKTFTRGTLEDVKVDNVIHTYKVGSSTKYVVLQDMAVEGKLDRVTETKDVTSVVVDGEAYDVPKVSPKKAVYEFKSNDKFYTLEADTAYRELDTFRGEEVRVLLGLDGKLQYIGSPVEFGDFVGIATRIVGRDMRVLNPDNVSEDYTANLDTKVEALNLIGTDTGHRNLNEIERNALVYINANGDVLEKVIELSDRVKVEKLTSRTIELERNLVEELGSKELVNKDFRINDETAVYVINTNGEAEVRKIADVVKAFEAADKAGKKVEASLVSESRYDYISVRGDKYARDDSAFAIAFYGLDIAPKLEDAKYGKLIRFYNRSVGKSKIVVELTSGIEATFTLHENVKNVDFVEGLYYEIEESKDTKDLAMRVNKVKFSGHGEVTNIQGNVYTVTGEAGVLYEVRATEFFGRKPRKDDKISYVKDAKNNDLKLVVNPSVQDAVEYKGLVTYIEETDTNLGAMAVDGSDPYIIDARTILRDKDNKVIQIGWKNIKNELKELDQVEVKADKDGVATEIKKLNSKADRDVIAARKALNDSIADAKALNKDNYTVASWAAIVARVEVAEEVVKNGGLQALKDAKTNLDKAVEDAVFAGMANLNAEINTLPAVSEADATEVSWKAYEVELAKAKAVKVSAKTNAEVAAAARALKLAKAEVVKKDGTEPEDPEEITATYEAVLNNVTGEYAVAVMLNDETKNDKVTKFIVDGEERAVSTVYKGKVLVRGSFVSEPTEVKVFIEGQVDPIIATK